VDAYLITGPIRRILGDKDHAFEWLKTSYHEHDPYLLILRIDPLFDCDVIRFLRTPLSAVNAQNILKVLSIERRSERRSGVAFGAEKSTCEQ